MIVILLTDKKQTTKNKFSNLPWLCGEDHYLVETASFNMGNSLHVQKKASALPWATGP